MSMPMIFFQGDFSPPTYVSVPNISMYPLVYNQVWALKQHKKTWEIDGYIEQATNIEHQQTKETWAYSPTKNRDTYTLACLSTMFLGYLF